MASADECRPMSASAECRTRRRAAIRSSSRRAATLAGVGILMTMVAPAFLGRGARAAVPPSATCPAAASTSGLQVAGYDLSAQAAGVRYALASPGLLPVGDPHQGTIMEFDVPFSRNTVSEGPVIDSLGSPAYPGDTAAHLGSAVATFGGPALPNDPVLAEAAYPPSPGHPASQSFGPAGNGTGAGTASATADTTGGTAQADAASSALSGGSGPPAASIGSSTSSTKTVLGSSCVSSSAAATSGAIDIGGVIHIAGITGTAAARSDGSKAVPRAELAVGQVTVGGLSAYIDQDGIHLSGQQPVGSGVVTQVQATLDQTLRASGLGFKLIEPVTTTKSGAASADSGGLEITMDRQVPATGVPGVPSLTVPGQGPIPLGTPPVPLHVEVIYGGAKVAVAATNAPSPSLLPTTGLPGGVAAPTAPGAGPAAASGSQAASSSVFPSGSVGASVTGPGAGPATRLTGSTTPATTGSPVGVGWVIIGVLASFLVAGPLFGYARWQLLEGRI